MQLLKDLTAIAAIADDKETENDSFREYLKSRNSEETDKLVHRLNNEITPQIDCTQCGQCCQSLMINITQSESEALAAHLQTSVEDLKDKYIETSLQGQMIMNTIPCHFLGGTSCTIYEHRFTECREFPHLHKDNFVQRLFGTLMHYRICPIIFNVIEALKIETGFTATHQQETV